MRMYELWKTSTPEGEPYRLEDAAGPVLFARSCDAEEYARDEPDRWKAHFTIVPVTVGRA